jgi:hypothetical protein
MILSRFRSFNFVLVFSLSVVLVFSQSLFAQDHVVSSADMQKDLRSAADTRQKDLAKVDNFFSSDEAQKAMSSAHVDSGEVRNAVHSLSDDELTRIAARVDQSQKDFSAGTVSNRDLIWIILGIAVLVLIIVAVRR